MKPIFVLLALITITSATLLQAETHILWQDDFESYDLGPWLGQGDTQVMQSSVNCVGDDPVEGEVDITNDGENWILHLGRKKGAPGIEQTKMDRGVRVPLDWGRLDYNHGKNAKIKIKGKTRIPEGNGYAEIRLTTKEDKPILRFTPHSSDYKTYFYNHNSTVNSSAANSANTFWVNADSGRTWYHTTNAVVYSTWCLFEIVIDCDLAQVEFYRISALDDSGFSFIGRNICHLRYMLERPEYVEFTAVGNTFDADRAGADFDDLQVIYEYEPPEEEWETLYEDYFQQYEPGKSLSEQQPLYKRLGSWEQYTDNIDTNEAGIYVARLFMGKPGDNEFPKDGVTMDLPTNTFFLPGQKLRLTATYYVPDNGCWTMFRKGDTPVATYGIHSATKWFTTWGTNEFQPRYDGSERAVYRHYITTAVTLAYDDEGPFLERVDLQSSEEDSTSWSFDWTHYYDTHLPDVPDNIGIQVQGWKNFDGRYVLLSYLCLEQTVPPIPEPAFLALLAALALAFARRHR